MPAQFIIGVVCIIIGIAFGTLLFTIIHNTKNKQRAAEASNIIQQAQQEAQLIKSQAEGLISSAKKDADSIKREAASIKRDAEIEAKDEALRMRAQIEDERRERQQDIREAEMRIAQREESLDRRGDSLDEREHQISSTQRSLDKRKNDLDKVQEEVEQRLVDIAGMSAQQAKEELLASLKDDVAHESAQIIRSAEEKAKLEADKQARAILSVAIQRMAAEHTVENTVSIIHIPSDDVKGRIIGREGRNIRAFETLTGTNLIIDDTPECVTISCFEPVRREIGRVTMENLIADGRIHPARIEEMYEKAQELVNQRVIEAGEQAVFDVGIHDLHPELVHTLGKLRYRTSYGQNVLNHSLEVSYLCGILASELGLDPSNARRAGLLHDIGKAIDREQEGSHALLGGELARRFGEKDNIVHAIEAHHNEIEPDTVLDVLVQAADAISAARPGARRETLEAYVKRLEKLEEIANSYEGVNRTYAIQAGREVRVMVEPAQVSEDQTVVLAHDIAQRVENEMQYPGQVKVVVIRESRAVGVAK